ncbi:MAG: ATP synthase subunit I [Bryobacteraceae bacterium]
MDLDEQTNPASDLASLRIIRRVLLWQIAMALAGIPAWWFWRDRLHAISFAAGALAAIGSFWLLERFTAALGGSPTSGGSLIVSALRLVLIGGALFVIIQNYKLLTVPLATGVLLTVVAITIEGIRELLYARTLDN